MAPQNKWAAEPLILSKQERKTDVMPESPIPYIVVPLALALFYFLMVVQPKWEKAAREKEDRIMMLGRELVAFVQMANTSLYEESKDKGYSYAQVVYITDPDVPNLEQELSQIAARLSKYEVQDETDETDRLIGSVMKTQMPYFNPLKLPPRVAGDRTAFTVSLCVHWSKLKARKLTQPLLRIRVLDTEDDGVRMLPEPGSSALPEASS